MRDDFPQPLKQKLSARAGHRCSNPECRAPTSGPQLVDEKSVNVGVAGHISGAAPGGPRYDALLTPAQRAAIKNGIWLCQTCSKLVDADELRYSTEILLRWKKTAEQEAHRQIGKAKPARISPSNAALQIKRDLKLRNQMRADFLKRPEEYDGPRPVRHPYEKFRHSEVIIHRLENDCYPEMDGRTGISSWFKVELFDFYHGGLVVILDIERGVISDGEYWAIIPHGADFDRTHFREIGIWKLGKIPFRNIRHHDLAGDEYYNFPHIYCEFADNGMPYEGFAYAVVGKNEYDWPLYPKKRLADAAVAVVDRSSELPDAD
jgi:hypothetical protein